jgi:hypothetical protein
MKQEEQLIIEVLIDRYSISKILEAIEAICYEKSNHISTNWQDYPLANDWHQAGVHVGTISGITRVKKVSTSNLSIRET